MSQARRVACRLALRVSEHPYRQDICFVPTGRYADMIERLRPGAAAAGDIVDLSGRVLGRHPGIINFTVGQRRGLGIAAGEPLYVVRLDAANGRVVVGPREALRTTRVQLRDVNWIGDGSLDTLTAGGRIDVFVKVRSTRPPHPAWLTRGADGFEVELAGGEEGVAPGQACALYDAGAGQARMLGGGFIRSAVAKSSVDTVAART